MNTAAQIRRQSHSKISFKISRRDADLSAIIALAQDAHRKSISAHVPFSEDKVVRLARHLAARLPIVALAAWLSLALFSPSMAAPPTSEETSKADALVDALVASGAQRAHVENCTVSIFGTLEEGGNENGYWGYQWDFYLPDYIPLEESEITTAPKAELYFVEFPQGPVLMEKLDIIQTLMGHYFPGGNGDAKWVLWKGAEGQRYLLEAEFKLKELLFGAKISRFTSYGEFGAVTRFASQSIPANTHQQAENVLSSILDYSEVARCEDFEP